MKPNKYAKPVSEYDLDQRYSDMLDEVHGECTVAGMSYQTSRALRELDPVAYRCGFSDWIDSECSDDRLVHSDADGEYYDADD